MNAVCALLLLFVEEAVVYYVQKIMLLTPTIIKSVFLSLQAQTFTTQLNAAETATLQPIRRDNTESQSGALGWPKPNMYTYTRCMYVRTISREPVFHVFTVVYGAYAGS